MKTDFQSRPVYVQRKAWIKAHFLICFISLLVYRLLEKKLGKKYTCSEIVETLRKFQFSDVGGQGFIPLYKKTPLTDELHCMCGIETDFEFITKSKMREIQKKSKGR